MSSPKSAEYARVESVTSFMVTAIGLPSAKPGDMVVFENGAHGQLTSVTDDYVTIMAFQDRGIQPGMKIESTGHPVSVPLYDNTNQLIISPLGEVLTDVKLGQPADTRDIDTAPPLLENRTSITRALKTGTTMADVLLPLGQGQRELIVGEEESGKTSFLLQLLAAQQQLSNPYIVYALIGKKADDVRRIYDFFTQNKVAGTLVVSEAHQAASLINLTPFTAMTIAEYHRDQGRDTLVILDDLSTHAEYYREMALLANQFPGRDSYPGDMFYVHARLLERAGSFVHPSKSDQSVAITCLPVAKNTGTDLTNYIVSNLISITDGHYLFDRSLVQQGRQPALNHRLSVTRVGRQTQSKLERQVTQELTRFLTKFQKTQELTHFGAELSAGSMHVLSQGQALTALLDQEYNHIVPQPVSLFLIVAVLMTEPNQAVAPELTTEAIAKTRQSLTAAYAKTKSVATQLDQLAAATDLAEFFKLVQKHQADLLKHAKN